MKRYIAIFAALLLAVSLLACDSKPAPKQFESENIKITLNEGFNEERTDAGEVAFVSAELCVYYTYDGIKYYGRRIETFERYCELVAKNNGMHKSEVVKENDLTYLVYDDEVLASEYSVVTFLFENDGEFSRFRFVCEAAQLEKRMPEILEYASSITVNKKAE